MIARKGGALCGLFIVAAVCVSSDRVVSGQNRDGGRRPQAVVRGTVTAADSGLPLRLAEVQISGGSLKSPLVVLTDSSGGYELRDLPAGQYP
jgi:carboxypeptidase family protein